MGVLRPVFLAVYTATLLQKEKSMDQTVSETLLTAKQVARTLNVHVNYVYNLATTGELPSFLIVGNRRFRASEVTSWIEGQRT